jgi:phytoene desaturase
MKKDNHLDAVIIGAGIGGIATALRLRKLGMSVLVLEKNERVGGKLEELTWEKFRWDKGPSLFTQPEQVMELFELYDRDASALFSYEKLPVSCKYFFDDGQVITMFADEEKRKTELLQQFSKTETQSVIDLIEESADTYNRMGKIFIDRPKFGIKNLLDPDLIRSYPLLVSAKMRSTLHDYHKRKLKNKNLVQLFDRYGTYNGSNPYQMSGLYSMIAHLELNEGAYFPKKGMRHIIESLYDLALEVGVQFETSQTSIQIQENLKGEFDIKSDTNAFTAKKIVSAIDCFQFYAKIMPQLKSPVDVKKVDLSTSAVVNYWAIDKQIDTLDVHNIFFTEDYRKEFQEIFDQKEIPGEPTIYVHVSSLINKADAPHDGQNWFVMINTPAGVEPTDQQLEKLDDFVLDQLEKHLKMDIRTHVIHKKQWTAGGIEEDTGAFKGALYGASSNGKISALTRHGNQSKSNPNIYFCGGTVHPGGGIPLVLKSAKIVAQLMKDAK